MPQSRDGMEQSLLGSAEEQEDVVVLTGKSTFEWRTFSQIGGAGIFVAIGYIDPGNWATGIRAGSKFGYGLLSMILFSSIMAWFLQILCIKLGIVTGNDLARQCKKTFRPWLSNMLYVLAELAIIATDMAELIGSAIALNLLFGIPLVWAVLITGADVLVILKWYEPKHLRYYELLVGILGLLVIVCFSIQLVFTSPSFSSVLMGYFPSSELFTNKEVLLIVIGIIGATVMPHNLYLHSSICKQKVVKYYKGEVAFGFKPDEIPMTERGMDASPFEDELIEEDREMSTSLTIWYLGLDLSIALLMAFFVNSMIVIVSASAFYGNKFGEEEEIQTAYHFLAENVHKVAATLFAVALLASGQSSTITGTIAGQIVMSGFLDLKMKPWLRKLLTRSLALIPSVVTVLVLGEKGLGNLLILSQVVLSLQLPFAILPLVYFTSSTKIMSENQLGDFFVNSKFVSYMALTIGLIISFLNVSLVFMSLF